MVPKTLVGSAVGYRTGLAADLQGGSLGISQIKVIEAMRVTFEWMSEREQAR